MKLPILIFLVSVNYCLSDIIDEDAKKFIAKPYPKKVNGGLTVINNAGKYIKYQSENTKKLANKEYTAFPGEKFHVPESVYFPIEKNAEKHRVKKVLHEYSFIRKKRSITTNKDDKKKLVTKKVKSPPRPPVAKKNTSKVPAKPGLVKPLKPNNPTKLNKPLRNSRKNRPVKRLGKNGKPIKRRRPRYQRLRKGSKRQRKQRSNRLRSKGQNPAKLRNRFGNKQAKQLINSRKNFLNQTNPQKDLRRLIASKDGLIEEFPYVVSIQKDTEHWCAGALLNQRLVITTANCLWKAKRISRMHIRVGSRHTDRGGQVAYISEVMKHPMWSIRTDPDHDVALLLLDRDLKFSHTVHSVDLPNRVMMPPFDDVWVTSWGAERRDGVFIPGSTLQVFHTRVLDRKKCNNVTERFGMTVSENFICLAQTGRRAPCTRDTGAPAVSDGVLWGLASWGIRKLCGTDRFPAMFSYVGAQSNMDFIINATHELMADERFYPFNDRYQLRALPSSVPP